MDHAIHEAHVSFVSGHSSFMFQAATFLALYLQARVSNVNFRMGILLGKPFLAIFRISSGC